MQIRDVILSIAMLLVSSIGVNGQSSFGDIVYQSYIRGEMSIWNKVIDHAPVPENDIEAEYEYVLAHYGFIGYCLEANKKTTGKKYLKKAMKLTDDLLAKHEADPRILALKGSLYGLQMGFDKRMAPILGPKALRKIEKALELNPKNPQALIEGGNKSWNMPKIMGGSHQKAIQEFEKAIRFMELDENFIRKNWYYLNVQVTLAKWYEEEGRISKSKRICHKLLKIEPDLRWAREKLKSFDL